MGFSARQNADEEEEMLIEEGGERIPFDLARNSFLNHCAKNLPSTMLGWHYRSRSESLISFSNGAFSAAQQDEFQSALRRLTQDDAVLRERLDAEWEREIDGQFVGLLVKNLENIQGDERDEEHWIANLKGTNGARPWRLWTAEICRRFFSWRPRVAPVTESG